MSELLSWLSEVLPIISKKLIDRTDKDLGICTVKAYWAGSVLRIDIQFK